MSSGDGVEETVVDRNLTPGFTYHLGLPPVAGEFYPALLNPKGGGYVYGVADPEGRLTLFGVIPAGVVGARWARMVSYSVVGGCSPFPSELGVVGY